MSPLYQDLGFFTIGRKSRGGSLALTRSASWVGCDRSMATAVGAWRGRNLGGLGRLDDSSISWASRASLSWLNGNHLGIEAH